MERIVGKDYRSYWMGIAILFIIMDHIVNPRGADDFAFKLIKMIFIQGGWGVNVFFFLSAYGLCHSWINNSLLGFYSHRFKRLFPMYLVYLLIVMIFRIQLKGSVFSFSYLFKRLLGINIINGDIMLSGDAWYMSAIIILYILFPVVFVCVRYLLRKSWSILFFSIVLLTLLYYFPGVLHIINGLFFARFHVILLGIATFFYCNAINKSNKDLLAIFSFTACLSLLTYNDCEFFFFIPLTLWAINEINIPLPLFSFFSFLGKHSLEIYLSQALVLQWFFAEMKGNYYIDILFCIILVLLFALFLWFIQTIFMRIINKLQLLIKNYH